MQVGRGRPHDRRSADTRRRLVDAGLRLFAERGFGHVTVRDLCREARANLAAVGYHFGDKMGLYLEVVQQAIAAIRQVGDLATQAPEGASPEERLRHYVRVYLPNLVRQDERHRWISRLMQHELSEPTPAAKLIADRAIRPRLEYLAGVVAALLECGPEDPRVRRSVMSIQAQCLFYLPRPFHQVVAPGAWPESDAEIERTAEHIVRFSLAGIRRLREETGPA